MVSQLSGGSGSLLDRVAETVSVSGHLGFFRTALNPELGCKWQLW